MGRERRRKKAGGQRKIAGVMLAVRAGLFLLTGLFCTLYFVVCAAYAGLRLSWLFIWPLGAAFCFVRFTVLCRRLKGIQKQKCPRLLRVLYYACFFVFLSAFVIVEGKVLGGMHAKAEPDLPYVIVLGAGVRGDVPTRPLLLRMQKACEYLKENPDTRVIASGGKGSGEQISEADCICRYLVENGIERDRILIEDRSASTEENIKNSFALIPEGTEKVGILSNGFHLYRAQRIANKQGHDNVTGIATKTLLPVGIHYTVREFFAIVKMEICGN